MNPDKICYGCFQEKGEGSICPHCGFDAQATQPYLALPLGTILNGRYMTCLLYTSPSPRDCS